MSKQHDDKNPSRIEMSEGDTERLITEIRTGKISSDTQELLIRLLLGWSWINKQLENKTLSIKKLLNLIFGPKTEKAKKTKKPNDDDESNGGQGGGKPLGDKPEPPKPKPKGHGKIGQAKYAAEKVPVPHSTMKPGDACLDCDGRLYLYGTASVLRIFGQAPLKATVYELEQLRCSSCQELYTAPLPVEAGDDRHHPTANAMVSLLNYGTGMPFYRLESLQGQMGVPLPDSTQFDMVEKVANCGAPVVNYFKRLAASGEKQGFDDTRMPILSLMKENKGLTEKDRTGMQTSAVVAQSGGNKIALFVTGRNHAGENMGEILADRDPRLPKVIQMSDAAPCNFSHDFMDLVTKALCMDHGRRDFHELLSFFPADCQHVIDELGKVYKNDADIKAMGLSPKERLLYHQEHSRPIMNGLNTWMEEKTENREVEPNGKLGGAIDYFLKHWNGLTTFLRIEGADLSNAEVERLIKRCVLRRKASMFYRTEIGAWIGDILMCLIETARFARKNPLEYLVALQKYATRVRANPELWLPWNYQQTLAAL